MKRWLDIAGLFALIGLGGWQAYQAYKAGDERMAMLLTIAVVVLLNTEAIYARLKRVTEGDR